MTPPLSVTLWSSLGPASLGPASLGPSLVARAGGALAQLAPGAGTGGDTSGAGSAPLSTLPHLVLPHVEYHLLLPQLLLIGSAVVLLGASSLARAKWASHVYALWTAITGIAACGWAAHLWGDVTATTAPSSPVNPATGAPVAAVSHAVAAVANAVAVDGFSLFFTILCGAILAVGALVAESYLPREGLNGPEFYVLAMLTAAGATIMASANDMIVLFLGLEILSISLYVLTGYHVRRITSGEAAIKYFVLGAFSSAFFLYGVALLYGTTGSTNLAAIAGFLATNALASNGVLLAAMGLLVVGLGFKVAAVPFHVWTPDVYQGAPSPVTGYMAAVAKAAGFAALLRVLLSALPTQASFWQPLVWVLAALSLVVGAVLAIVQTNVKRMLAYSSISHAGFVLVALGASGDKVASGEPRGQGAALFYLMAYAFMIVGTFAIVSVVGREGDGRHRLEDYRGLARRRPALAFALAILLMGQAGVPFTAGFFAKFYVILAVVGLDSAAGYALAVIAMLSAVVAAFFYLRLILAAYSSDESDAIGRVALEPSMVVAVAVPVLVTIGVGVVPAPLIHLATHAGLLF
jgi:NADH-quinone oxidoreductase subunit N